MARRASAKEQRQRIAKCAFTVLARDGLEAFAMRRVAQEADCTIGLINHWFSSKEDLVTAAWNEALERENERIAAMRAKGEVSAQQVIAESLPLTQSLREEALVWMAFRALSVSNPGVRSACKRRYALARRLLGDMLAGGRPRTRDDESAAELMVSALEGISIMAALDPARWPAERQRRALASLIDPLVADRQS
jgi:AcrR family transcriptional regulator